jgi:hypothetical protein
MTGQSILIYVIIISMIIRDGDKSRLVTWALKK